MADCLHCGVQSDLPFRCQYCDAVYCKEHRLPEAHDCDGVSFKINLGKHFESNSFDEIVAKVEKEECTKSGSVADTDSRERSTRSGEDSTHREPLFDFDEYHRKISKEYQSDPRDYEYHEKNSESHQSDPNESVVRSVDDIKPPEPIEPDYRVGRRPSSNFEGAPSPDTELTAEAKARNMDIEIDRKRPKLFDPDSGLIGWLRRLFNR